VLTVRYTACSNEVNMGIILGETVEADKSNNLGRWGRHSIHTSADIPSQQNIPRANIMINVIISDRPNMGSLHPNSPRCVTC
jgi:hypothetical protein